MQGLPAAIRMMAAGASDRSRRSAAVFRWVTLAAAFFWSFHFLLTQRLAGGLDARWYGHVVIDAVAQARQGIWPVLVGQGPWEWNGAVHPYRTAPYFVNLAAALDFFTGHLLTPIGVEHLTLLFVEAQSVTLIYLCLSRLGGGACWLAWAAALGWVLAPLALAYVGLEEMYMTVMTFGWLPLVFFGNARIVRRDDAAGWAWLVTGLALVWMSHASVAAWTSLMVLFMQGFRLAFRDFNRPALGRAAGATLLFLVLAGGYLYSVAELSPPAAATSLRTQVGLLALLIAFFAAFRLQAGGAGHWCWPAFASLAMLWTANRLYCNWVAADLVWAALVRFGQRRAPGSWLVSRAPELALAGLLGAAALAVQLPFSLPLSVRNHGLYSLLQLHGVFPGSMRPISPLAPGLADLQLGYSLWAGAAFGLVIAIWSGEWTLRLPALALVLFTAFLVPIPAISRCLEFGLPEWLYGISTLIWIRLLPAYGMLVVFTAFGAAVWLARRPGGGTQGWS